MNTRKTIAALLCAAMLGTSVSASAQLGSFARKALGGNGSGAESTGGVSSADAAAFLDNALESTKNVMISAALLSQAVADRTQLASKREYIAAIKGAQSFKEVDAHSAALQSDLNSINENTNFAAQLKATYDAGNADQKKLIGAAVYNLALGIYRNTQLAGQASSMVQGVGSNPQLATRAGEFRKAASLLGLQGKGLVSVGGSLPQLMTSMKIKAPAQAATTREMPVDI